MKDTPMKIIEGLKQEKELVRKLDDLKKKIRQHSAHLSNENPVYPDQKKQVGEWVQAACDILKDIEVLRIRIQHTNLETPVTMEFKKGDKPVVVTKNIAEWIHRRRQLASLQHSIYACLTDKGLKEGTIVDSNNQKVEVKIVRCYDPVDRDKNLDVYGGESAMIDSKLEVTNAVTDLLPY